MIKSKYLILNSFYFDFNNDLTEIKEIKALFENQNILDLLRFDKMKTIIKEKFFKYKNINFVYLPKNIESLESGVFSECKIQSLDLSRYIKLKNIKEYAFFENQIKYLKLPKNIEIINDSAFSYNQIKQLKLPENIETINHAAFYRNKIKTLDLSNYTKLKTIVSFSFVYNQIKQLKLPKNIKIVGNFAFANNKIEILDLSNCTQLKEIDENAFLNNPLNEIKILDNIEIGYDKKNIDDLWNKFSKYYNDNKMKSGDYKYNNNEWKWYPL